MSAWTRNTPTDTGWYWYRDLLAIQAVAVRPVNEIKPPVLRAHFCDGYSVGASVLSGEWQPIEQPKV